MRAKIELIKSTFQQEKSSGKWGMASSDVFRIGDELIKEFGTRDENRLYAICLGTIVVTLAEELRKYASKELHGDKFTKENSLTWPELYQQCDIRKQYNYPPDTDVFSPRIAQSDNMLYRNTILRAGQKILQQELPFDIDKMKAAFPTLTPLLDEINAQYPLVAEVFDTKSATPPGGIAFFAPLSPTTPKTKNLLVEELKSYIATRRSESERNLWSNWGDFHYNMLGIKAFIYFLCDALLGTDHFNTKEGYVKVNAASKLLNNLDPRLPFQELTEKEVKAAHQGRLGNIVSFYGGFQSIEEQFPNRSENEEEDQISPDI